MQATHMTRLGVEDTMRAGVFTCDRDAPLSDVAATMATERVHCIVVESGSGDGGPLWGVVSDLDLVAAATVRERNDQDAGGSALDIARALTLEKGAP